MNLLQAELVSADLGGQRQFYAGVLGLPVSGDADRLEVTVGLTRLVFRAGERPPGPYHLAFDVPEHRFGEATAWLRERAPLLHDAGQETFFSEHWNAHMLYFRDADGNILELIGRHTLPRPGHAGLLVNVSEVGVAAEDVPGALQTLHHVLGADLYRPEVSRLDAPHTPPQTFAPAGTHGGLLIVVQRGRPWFPTAQAAIPLPLKIVAQTTRAGEVNLPLGPVQITGLHHP